MRRRPEWYEANAPLVAQLPNTSALPSGVRSVSSVDIGAWQPAIAIATTAT